MWTIASKYRFYLRVLLLISSYDILKCNAISNTSLNQGIREYSAGDGNNITSVKTLQKEELGKHAYYVPAGTPINFKEISDSALSGSSNSRGLLYHDHPGYGIHDYEESPHYDYGHEYQFQEHHPDPHGHSPQGYDHHDYDPHHYGGHHHHDHGHYKHYKHALATKAVLWPLAGIALLGAAAALVSNPVLLQLGVVSGKRKRRDTEEITEPEFTTESLKIYADKLKKFNNEAKDKIANLKRRVLRSDQVSIENPINANFKRRILIANYGNDVKGAAGIKGHRASVKSVERSTIPPGQYKISDHDDDNFVPIPIKLRSPKISDP